MKYYQEITLINGDKSYYEIWSILYGQLHIAFVDLKNKHNINTIGVSFPYYKYEANIDGKEFAKLGDKLRLFAPSKSDLEKLNIIEWIDKVNTDDSIRAKWKLDDSFDIKDSIHIKSIQEVGNKVASHVCVRRYRFKPVEVQAASLAEKLNISFEEAMTIVAKRQPELHVPYIRMYSESNKTHYLLRILQEKRNEETNGRFNVYGMNGMSGKVTVPHW